MTNGNPNAFLDRIYSGQDTVYVFRGNKYWCQGYARQGAQIWRLEVFQCAPPLDGFVFEYESKSVIECVEAYIKAPIFEGKSFWEVESEIKWVDS